MTAPYRVPDGFFDLSGRYPRAKGLEIRCIGDRDDEYPPMLRDIDGAPERLWVAGRDLRDLGPCVAIIGARRATEYGLSVATRLAADVALQGFCIVSGLARGADAAAHQGALRAGGATIAALGCGVDVCYPSGSRALYAQIAEHGALVSAYPPGTPVHKAHLIRRNDLLIGMSRAIVVVQGDKKSAAVATGARAAEWTKEVLAVPGCIDWEMSAGVNALIRDGAKICTGSADVLAALGIHADEQQMLPIPQSLSEAEQLVLETLANGPQSRETLVALTRLDPATLTTAIASLELERFVQTTDARVRRIR